MITQDQANDKKIEMLILRKIPAPNPAAMNHITWEMAHRLRLRGLMLPCSQDTNYEDEELAEVNRLDAVIRERSGNSK